MERGGWMALRAYAPAGLALAAAMALTWVTTGLQAGPLAGAIIGEVKWIVFASFAYGVIHFGWTTYRLWRADRGEGLLCACGGLLGLERDGRYGPYRRCLGCGDNVARRNYESLE